MKKRIVFFIINHFLCGTTHYDLKRKLLVSAGITIGNGTRIVGPIVCTTSLKIGNNCFIGKNFTCNGNGKVIIEDNCDIGPEVIFQTGGHIIGLPERRAGKGFNNTQIVKSGTWVGGRSTIIGDTTIGKSCVIAGCACVVTDVPDNTLVGGVPAKEIRKL